MIQHDCFIWQNNGHFGGFILTDKENDKVAGYEWLAYGEGFTKIPQHAVTLGYIFNKDYHRSATIKNVGGECIYALLEGYCKNLYEQKVPIPRTYDSINELFVGESFTKIDATARRDNPASIKLLTNFGFKYVDQAFIYNHDRNIYVKDFEAEQLVLSGQDNLD